MKPKGYLLFHLNLAFSSIEEEAWADVIRTCYHPLLDLVEKTEVPIGVELTGWTLKQIERIDISWIKRFKILLNSRSCELIGSGYCQIIGPLIPYNVNEWNQKLGIDTYKKILNCRPDIVLVNEMAFSSSLIDLYTQFEYKGFVMDRDNVKMALHSNNPTLKKMPTHAEGLDGSVIPVLWSDSILFQKVQHYAHGDISIKDYETYLKSRIEDGELILPIYCSDAEIFDYRPGRFSEERPTHHEGEWKRIERLLKNIDSKIGIEFISPTQALGISNQGKNKFISKFVNASYPIPVKKQSKYNITRWAVTGRDDLWINTMCHRIEQHLTKSKNNNHHNWEELCELWSSDLRTHITDERWNKAKSQLDKLLKKLDISNLFGRNYEVFNEYVPIKNIIGKYGGTSIALDKEGILLTISTQKIKLQLNLRRGLTINSLAFSSHKMKPCIGTLPHGYFSCISLGADFYSGGVVIELPLQRGRITDLEKVEPTFFIKDNGNIVVHAKIRTKFGTIIKIVEISTEREKVSLSYNFPEWDKIIGSVRLGVITLLNEFADTNTKLLCSNGGKNNESFNFTGEFNHTKTASTLVSSSRGLGATTGKIQINNDRKYIYLEWDPSECAVMPMLQNQSFNNKTLSRVMFSMKEVDETVKFPSNIQSFSLAITTS